jgi:hypothetical protein
MYIDPDRMRKQAVRTLTEQRGKTGGRVEERSIEQMLQIPHSMEKRMNESKPRYWDLKEHACVCFAKSLSQGD